MSESVLQEADRLINGDRAETYGDAKTEFENVAAAWSIYLGHTVTPIDYTNMMIILKVLRARHGYHRDSYVDICGYAALGERVSAEPFELSGFPQEMPGAPEYMQPVELDEPSYKGLASEKSVGTLFVDVNPRFTGWLNEFKQLCGLPREWDSLRDIPEDVTVADSDGDVWSCRGGKWGFEVPATDEHPADPWGPLMFRSELSSWDWFAPFTEVLVPKKPEPRVWQYVNDEIPLEVELVRDRNEDDWVRVGSGFERAAGLASEYVGPFTEVLEGAE